MTDVVTDAGFDTGLAPLSGSPAGVRGLAARSTAVASALDDARAGVRRVVAVLAGERSGAVRAARLWLEDVEARLTTCAEVLGTAAAALDRHADMLGREQGAALRALARRDDALAQVRRHQWEELGAPTWQAMAAERSLLAAQAEVYAAEAEWRRARDAKRAASSQAAAVLRGLGDVRALRAAVTAGTDVAGFRSSWLRGQRVAGMLDAAATGTRDRVDRVRAELQGLLTAAADDPVFWTSFWDTATPQQVYLALGPGVGIPTTPPSAALRESLAGGVEAWARTAGPEELAEFGAAAVDGVGSWTGLTERAGIAATLLPPTLPAAVHGAAFDALDARPSDDAGDELDAAAPLWLAVAVGLAAHPRLAFDRLAPSDPARLTRVSRRWFGTSPGTRLAGGRGPGWPDGGTAVAGAFRAAVETGSGSPRRSEQARAARLVSAATTDLPGGLLAREVSDGASVHLARAYEPYVPAFAEADEQPVPGVTDGLRLTARGVRPTPAIQPELDAFALRDVIAATSGTTVAADAWLSAGDRFGAQVADVATSGGFDDQPLERGSLGHRYLQDVGVIAGSTQAETVSTARQRTADRDLAIGVVGFATAKSPELVANTVGAVTTVLPAVLPDLVAPARESVLAAEPELRHQFAAPLHDEVVAHDVGRGVPRAQAERWAAELDPDDSVVCDVFRGTYTDASDVRPEQGERSCQGR